MRFALIKDPDEEGGRRRESVGLFDDGVDTAEGSNVEDVPDAAAEGKKEKEFFEAYSRFPIHRAMLQDEARMAAYSAALIDRRFVAGKTVLDVGCGTGALSLMAARGGASRVYAIEASSVMAAVARQNVKDNGFSGVVTVVEGFIEDAKIPANSVDAVLSEWMGYCLFFEGMLDSVLKARRLLSPGGIMLPDFAKLQICLFSCPEQYEQRRQLLSTPVFKGLHTGALFDAMFTPIKTAQMSAHYCVSTEDTVAAIDLETVPESEVGKVDHEFRVTAKYTCEAHGIVIYFAVQFGANPPVVLDTSPWGEPTHWQQSVLYFKEPLRVYRGREVSGRFQLRPMKRRREIEVRLQIGDDAKKEVTRQFVRRA